MGFSQGSMLVNAVALTYPDKIKNIISLSGAFDPKYYKSVKFKVFKKIIILYISWIKR